MLRKVFLCAAFCFFLIFIQLLYVSAESCADDLVKDPAISLKHALVRGIEKNLGLQAKKLDIPINREAVVIDESKFDPVLDASVLSLEEKTPTASAFAAEDFDLYRSTGADIGIGKIFGIGLESRLSFEANRSMNNSSVDALRPQYSNFVILDLTQPLFRDFGSKINTTDLRISQNMVRQTVYGYLDSAQETGKIIETTYYDLAKNLKILTHRIESETLTMELLEGNRKKFEAGLVPVTEVQEAETELASRNEKVVLARQQADIVSNRLKDLLEIRAGDLCYKERLVPEPAGSALQPFPDQEMALEIAFEKRPDLLRQRIELANRDIRIEYFDNQMLPRVDLEATLGVNGFAGDNRPVSLSGFNASTSPYQGNFSDALSDMSEGEGYEWYVGLRMSCPLGNRAAAARLRRAGQEKQKVIYLLKSLEGKVETDVKNAMVAVEGSLERVKVTERFEKLAEITLEQEMERLKNGLSDTFRVLTFQNNLIEARIRKVTALVDFNKGLAGLYRAMGTNLARFNIVAELNGEEINYEKN